MASNHHDNDVRGQVPKHLLVPGRTVSKMIKVSREKDDAASMDFSTYETMRE